MKKLVLSLVLAAFAVASASAAPKVQELSPLGAWPLCVVPNFQSSPFCKPVPPQTYFVLIVPSSEAITAFRWTITGTFNDQPASITDYTTRAGGEWTYSRAVDLTGWTHLSVVVTELVPADTGAY